MAKPQTLWVFAWVNPKVPKSHQPYITRITDYSRALCKQRVAKDFGEPWDNLQKQGGRVIKCVVQPLKEA